MIHDQNDKKCHWKIGPKSKKSASNQQKLTLIPRAKHTQGLLSTQQAEQHRLAKIMRCWCCVHIGYPGSVVLPIHSPNHSRQPDRLRVRLPTIASRPRMPLWTEHFWYQWWNAAKRGHLRFWVKNTSGSSGRGWSATGLAEKSVTIR